MFIEDITPETVQAFFNDRKHLAQETQQKQMNVLRMILDMAVEPMFSCGVLQEVPMSHKFVTLIRTT